MTKLIQDDENKTILKRVLESPEAVRKIRDRMLLEFSRYAAVDPEATKRIVQLTDEFKTLVHFCLEAKTGADEREVLLAFEMMSLDWATAMLLEHATAEEVVSEDMKVATETVH